MLPSQLPLSFHDLNNFRRTHSVEVPPHLLSHVHNPIPLIQEIDQRLDWTYSNLLNHKITDLTHPHSSFSNELLIQYIKFIYDNYGIVDPMVKYAGRSLPGSKHKYEGGEEEKKQVWTLGNNDGSTEGMRVNTLAHAESSKGNISTRNNQLERLPSGKIDPLNHQENSNRIEQGGLLNQPPSINDRVVSTGQQQNMTDRLRLNNSLSRQPSILREDVPPKPFRPSPTQLSSKHSQQYPPTTKMSTSKLPERRSSMGKISLTSRSNIPKRPKMLETEQKTQRESETPLSSNMNPEYTTPPRYSEPPPIHSHRNTSHQLRQFDTQSNTFNNIPLDSSQTFKYPESTENELKQPYIDHTRVETSRFFNKSEEPSMVSMGELDQKNQMTFLNFPNSSYKSENRNDVVSRSTAFRAQEKDYISREADSLTGLKTYEDNGNSSATPIKMFDYTIQRHEEEPFKRHISHNRSYTSALYETPLKQSRQIRQSLKDSSQPLDQTTTVKHTPFRYSDFVPTGQKLFHSSTHLRMKSSLDMTSTQASEVPSIYRYCFICEHLILEFNIDAHENNCPHFKELYTKSFEEIVETLILKIERQQKTIEDILMDKDEDRLRNLRPAVSTWLQSMKGVSKTGQNSLELQRKYEEIMRCSRSKELKLLELSHKLKWFMSLRQHVKESFNM